MFTSPKETGRITQVAQVI